MTQQAERVKRSATGDEYLQGRPTSARLYAEAQDVFPSGITHDSRYMTPFPLYIARAAGSRKWDVDGNEYIDFVMGHGALLLGHSHPAVVEAVTRQLAQGTHPGACTELELEWGRLVQRLVPCAERVKFTSSGTEATLMAMQLVRAFTGKPKIAKFQGHFHGWNDYAKMGEKPPFHNPVAAGVPQAVAETMVVLDPADEAGIEERLTSDPDIGGIILEPTGASSGTVPFRPGFLQWLRDLTRRTGVVLIFDEVITGFRLAPGGAQEYFGVTPDMTTLAKILAGGLPGGAVVGRADILEHLEFKAGDADWNQRKRVSHPGTFNANPVSAAAGVAALSIAATGEPQAHAAELGTVLRREMNSVLSRKGVSGCVYGMSSLFKIYIGPCDGQDHPDGFPCTADPSALKAARSGPTARALRRYMLAHGADIQGSGGTVSAAHTMEDVEAMVQIFERALEDLGGEGLL